MLRFKCLVLDHDNTVVQSEKTVSYPCFVETMQKFRPEVVLSYETFVQAPGGVRGGLPSAA